MAWSNDLSQWNRWAPLEADRLQQTGACGMPMTSTLATRKLAGAHNFSGSGAGSVVVTSGFDISWTSGLWGWIEAEGSISILRGHGTVGRQRRAGFKLCTRDANRPMGARIQIADS